MKYSILLFLTLFLLSACSQNSDIPAKDLNEPEITFIPLPDSSSVTKAVIDSSLVARIDELEENLLFLENKSELLQEQLDFYTDRFENIINAITANNRRINKLEGIKNKQKTDNSHSDTNPSPQELYAQARSHYVNNQLTQASSKFTEFLRKYPDHELIINCKYWLAEIDYDQENFPQAILKFQEISNTKANPEKRIDSLFKIAVINKRLGNFDLALQQANEIESKYPNYIRNAQVKAFIKDLQ